MNKVKFLKNRTVLISTFIIVCSAVFFAQQVTALSLKTYRITNNTGATVSDLHLMFDGTQDDVIVTVIENIDGCPEPQRPSNETPSNMAVLNWEEDCVGPGAQVVLSIRTEAKGPLRFKSGFWTSTTNPDDPGEGPVALSDLVILVEVIDWLPPGVTVLSGGIEAGLFHGCPDQPDNLLKRSETDNNGQQIELWSIDGSYFGVRFVRKNDDGDVVVEKWIGICPYSGGGNRTLLFKKHVEEGGFLWDALNHLSLDRDVGEGGDGSDDIDENKQDSYQLTFNVETGILQGYHLEDGESVGEHRWDCTPDNDITDIPGDPSSETDSPRDLLDKLPSDGDMDPREKLAKCPSPAVTQDALSLEITLVDCNNNNFPDLLDIATGQSRDANMNGVPDECESFDAIPTLTEWGMIIFSILLMGWMARVIVNRRKRAVIA